MFEGSSLYVLTIPAVIGIVVASAIRRRPYLSAFAWIAFAVYVTEVLALTFFPLPIDPRLIADSRADQFFLNNFIPLATIASVLNECDLSVVFMQIGGNILLLLPLGFFLPVLFRRMNSLGHVVIAVSAASMAIEGLQLLLSSLVFRFVYKSFDVDDLLLNFLGGLLGYALFTLFRPVLRRSALGAWVPPTEEMQVAEGAGSRAGE